MCSIKRIYVNTYCLFADQFKKLNQVTMSHSYSVASYSYYIAVALNMSYEEIYQIYTSALLHDIGKSIVPENILEKSGKLDKSEWLTMMEHSRSGFNIIQKVSDYSHCAHLVLHHHERFDGRGYPDGLTSYNIPLGSRIISVADAFDAMISKRSYKEAIHPQLALDEITRCSGSQFDPGIVNVFNQLMDCAIYSSHEFLRKLKSEK